MTLINAFDFWHFVYMLPTLYYVYNKRQILIYILQAALYMNVGIYILIMKFFLFCCSFFLILTLKTNYDVSMHSKKVFLPAYYHWWQTEGWCARRQWNWRSTSSSQNLWTENFFDKQHRNLLSCTKI